MEQCQACGAELVEGAKFCGECGEPVSTDAADTQCRSCGAELVEGAKFCGECGEPTGMLSNCHARTQVVQPAYASAGGDYGQAQAVSPGVGVAGFVLVLIGLFVPILGLVGFIMSIIGYQQAKRDGLPTGLSLAGVIIGAIATVTGIIVAIVFLAVIGASGVSSAVVVPFAW